MMDEHEATLYYLERIGHAVQSNNSDELIFTQQQPIQKQPPPQPLPAPTMEASPRGTGSEDSTPRSSGTNEGRGSISDHEVYSTWLLNTRREWIPKGLADIPTHDPVTGEQIPEWKRLALLNKANRKVKEFHMLQQKEQESYKTPLMWKQELHERRYDKLLIEDEPILQKRKAIYKLQYQIEEESCPPWQRELLVKKRDRLQSEVREWEHQRDNELKERHRALGEPFQSYYKQMYLPK